MLQMTADVQICLKYVIVELSRSADLQNHMLKQAHRLACLHTCKVLQKSLLMRLCSLADP